MLTPRTPGLELCWEELKHVLGASGFALEAEKVDVPCHYTLNQRSLHRTQYRAVFFIARRVS